MFRFLFEFNDPSGIVCVHDTEAACLLHRNFDYSDGRVSIAFFVVSEHLCVIHFVDMVSGENQKIFRRVCIDEIDIL